MIKRRVLSLEEMTARVGEKGKRNGSLGLYHFTEEEEITNGDEEE